MDKKYCLIVKTGDSELRAMKNLPSESLNKILSVVELTRGRAKNIGTKEAPKYIYPYDSKLKKVREIFGDRQIVLDVTSEISLSSLEIDELFDYANGYEKWRTLVSRLSTEGLTIVPSILRNYDDENYERNLKIQLQGLSSMFSELMYRCPLDDSGMAEDLSFINDTLPASCSLIVILDCGWIPAASYKDPAEVCVDKIAQLKKALGERKAAIAVCATTFPNNISEIGDDVSDTFHLGEIDLHEMVREKYPEVIYGDYGSINPIRNDQIVMTRGWIPRIDVALERLIYYYRDRRGSRKYSDTYTSVAGRAVSDPRFPLSMEACWGISQIKNCSLGDAPSASPSFWISVRMNSHIEQQIVRLKL